MLGDRNITVREDKAPTKSAPAKSSSRTSTMGDQPAAEGCRCYVGNLAWETTTESLIGESPDAPRRETEIIPPPLRFRSPFPLFSFFFNCY